MRYPYSARWCIAVLMLASVCFADTSARADLPGDAPIQPVDARTLLAEPVLLDQSSTTAWNDPGNASATLMATQPSNPPQSYAERSIAEIIGHFSGYEPMYFIAGPYNPDVKFQFSFKYALFNKDAPLSKQIPLISGLHFAYTQLNLWKLGQPSTAFYDTNYMPEFFYSNEDIRAIHLPGVAQLGLQTGIGHDSNGQGNTNERAINILFLRPILDFGDPENFHFYIAPKAYVYIVDVEDNPDIAKFRGYCDFTSVIGWRQGLELSFLGRIGSDYNRGCVQFDLTFPVRDVLDHNLDLYLDAQYFNGYGESLLSYNRRTQAFRIGVALVR